MAPECTVMNSSKPYTLRFIFDDQCQPLVRVEELYRSGLGKTAVRQLVEAQRKLHYAAQPNQPDPYWTPHGRLVFDWLQTLPRSFGCASSTELYNDFICWAREWEGVNPPEFTHTRWGRLMNHWVQDRRTNRGIVYDGVSLP